jgi:DNA repair protein RecO (recombination protein O)
VTIVRDRALLLKRYPFGESSLVAHLCTREHGRVHLIAKGVYRPTSRFFAALDFLDTLEIEWDHAPRRDLANLRSAAILARRRAIPNDRPRWFAANGMLELADLASRAAHPDPALFDLLEGGLDELESDRAPSDVVLVAFELSYLEALGLSPALQDCAACGGTAQPVVARAPSGRRGSARPRAAFSAGAGGRLCRACAEESRASGRRVGTLPVETLDDARRFQSGGVRRSGEAGSGLSQDRIDRVRDFVGRFLDYHLEARPRTHRAFLAQANRNAATEAAEAV